MSKSASEIEREIASRVRGCRLPARGFWYEMRRLIETESQRPGELLRDGVPLSVEQLAHEAGCSSKKVPLLLEKLKAAKLLDQTAGGAWYSPIWLSLAKARASQKARTARSRNRGVLRNTPKREKGALRNAHVTPHPPPSSHLSPTPPLLLSSHPPGEASGCAGGKPPPEGGGGKGGKGRGKGPFALLNAHFIERWEAKYRTPFRFRPVDAAKLAELLKSVDGCLEDAMGVIDRFLADDDQFLHGHAPAMLMGASMFPRYLTPKGANSGNGHKQSAHRGTREGLTL